MIKQDPKPLIAFLNSIAKIDPDAIDNLINSRVQVNKDLRDHPSVQCTVGSDGKAWVGFLGLLNGYCGTFEEEGPKKGWGPIVAVYDDDDCKKFLRFEHTLNPVIKASGPEG